MPYLVHKNGLNLHRFGHFEYWHEVVKEERFELDHRALFRDYHDRDKCERHHHRVLEFLQQWWENFLQYDSLRKLWQHLQKEAVV